MNRNILPIAVVVLCSGLLAGCGEGPIKEDIEEISYAPLAQAVVVAQQSAFNMPAVMRQNERVRPPARPFT